jgi:hypothetical protein
MDEKREVLVLSTGCITSDAGCATFVVVAVLVDAVLEGDGDALVPLLG